MKTRIKSLDTLKGIAALFIIWIHEQFPGTTGQLIDRIGMFAVPVFFMVSGFFARTSSREKLTNSIRHTLLLLGLTYVLNILRIIVFQGFAAALKSVVEALSLRSLILLGALNISPISGVAWFLFALLYCYILHWIFHKYVQNQRIFLLIPLCFTVGFAVRCLLPSIGDHNAWFMGIPYYLCGQWFCENREKIERTPLPYFVILAWIGFSVLVFSLFVFDPIFYIGHIFLSIPLFALCIHFPNWHNPLLARIGSTYNYFVYVGHALMIHIFNAILPGGDSMLLAWVRPVLLAAATFGCAALWYDVIRRKKV